MFLVNRLKKIERRLPDNRYRITKIIETIVDEQLVPIAVIREDIDAGVAELWLGPEIPEPLPEGVDAAAAERFKASSLAFPSSA
jgi:hypothetical protein